MTITSQIHIGLSAWQSSHSYSVLGTRVSNGGKAYQVIGTGTSASSGGPTGVNLSITDGTVTWKYLSIINYTSLASWLASIPGTLTEPIVGQLWNDSILTTTVGTPFLVMTGHVTSSTNTITLASAPGESFRDTMAGQTTALAYNTSNGVAFRLPNATGSGSAYFNITDNYVTFSGLQFQDPDATSATALFQTVSGCTNLTLTDCIFDGYAQSGFRILDLYQAVSPLCSNLLIIDRQAGNGFSPTLTAAGSTNAVYINCTITNLVGNTNGSAYDVGAGTGAIVRNCAFFGYSNPLSSGPIAADHCCFSASSVGTGGTNNGGNIFNITASSQFVSATTDFRLQTNSVCLDSGVVDTTNLPAADDLAGTHRPEGATWDIGCWEFVAANPIPWNLGADPPANNFILLADPYNPGFVGSVTDTLGTTSIVLNWIAPSSPLSLSIVVDTEGITSIICNTVTTTFLVTAVSAIALYKTVSSTTSFFKLTCVSSVTVKNIASTAVAFPSYTSTVSLSQKGTVVSSGILLGMSCVGQISQASAVSAAVNLLKLNANVLVNEFVNAQATVTFLRNSTTATATIRNIVHGTSFFASISGHGATSAPFFASSIDSLFVLKNSAFITIPPGNCIVQVQFFPLTALVYQQSTTSSSSTCSFLPFTIVSNVKLIDNASSATTVKLLTPVVNMKLFNIAHTTVSLFVITGNAVASAIPAYGSPSLFIITCNVATTQSDTLSSTITLPIVVFAPIFYPPLQTDGLQSFLLEGDNPSFQLLADVSPLNITVYDIASATLNFSLQVSASALLNYNLSPTLNVLSISPVANILLQDLASGTLQFNLTPVAYINEYPTTLSASINWTVTSSTTQLDISQASLFINWSASVSAGQSNVATETSIISLQSNITSVQSDATSTAQNINYTFQGTAIRANVAKASGNFNSIVSSVSATMRDAAYAFVNIMSLSATGATLETNYTNATANFNLTAVGRITEFVNVSATANINLSASVTALNSRLASCSATFSFTASGVFSPTYPAAVTAVIPHISSVATAVVNGSKFGGTPVIEVIFLSSNIQLFALANTLAEIIVSCGPTARLWVTPQGYVAGDLIVYWTE